jgi:hypothetical protein
MESEPKYETEKRCCYICDGRKLCHVCGQQTLLACSDCRIDLAATVRVCNKQECRDAHDKVCPAVLKAAIAAWNTRPALAGPDIPELAITHADSSQARRWMVETYGEEVFEARKVVVKPIELLSLRRALLIRERQLHAVCAQLAATRAALDEARKDAGK